MVCNIRHKILFRMKFDTFTESRYIGRALMVFVTISSHPLFHFILYTLHIHTRSRLRHMVI